MERRVGGGQHGRRTRYQYGVSLAKLRILSFLSPLFSSPTHSPPQWSEGLQPHWRLGINLLCKVLGILFMLSFFRMR
ncbi:hypothetical protein LZ30DRAFT_729525 [Colletotrichum cereale]|nr:hypothetical protein LZ30DRAFT_729525 [Colletotrichum cereale]